MDGHPHTNADARPVFGDDELIFCLVKRELMIATPFCFYELLISGFGSCGMIQLINACGERVCI